MSDFEQKLLQGFVNRPPITPEEAAELVRIAESAENYRQVSKELCGKENATLEEVLRVINQVTPRTFAIPPRSGKTLAFQRIAELEKELAAVKRERDAALADLDNLNQCYICAHVDCWDEEPCFSCIHRDPVDNFTSNFIWRGVCPENTEVQDNGD